MIDEKNQTRIIELREGGATIRETAKALDISESTVQRHSGNYNNDIKSGITSNKTNPLKDDWMVRLFGDDWNDNNELMQLFFDLNRLASETNLDLEAFLVKIEFMICQYYRYSDKPLKLYDFSLNVASSMTFISDTFDMELFINKVEAFIDKTIFLDKLDEVITGKMENLEELKEKINKAQERFGSLTKAETIFMKKLLDNPAERKLENVVRINQNLQILIQKIAKEGLLYKTKNLILNSVFERFQKNFPEEVKSIVEEITNEKLQCEKNTIS